MVGTRQVVALVALAVVVAGIAFTAGRMTRADEPIDAQAPTLQRTEVDASLPALAVSKTVPPLKEKSVASSTTPGEAPAQSAPSGSGSTGGAAPTGGGGGGGSTGGGSSPPVVVGGGTE